ncbi:MAG: SusC/RagA family TonB-linked outer membrane protein [Gemmatimonadaceae bacterium]
MYSRHVRRLLVLALAVAPAALGAQQTGTVRGHVTEASSGAPITDAQVMIEGTLLGAATGDSGQYVIALVPAGSQTVVVRRLGFTSSQQTVTLAGGATMNVDFTLRPNAVTLEEVVVTGTGAPAERRVLGNTIESIAGEAVSEAPGAVAIDQALQGKVPGAVISENSGQPGGGVSIRLRGTNSILGGAEPLYVIDGVIIDNSSEALISIGANATRGGAALTNRLADIDPDNVDRIEILKGAAAAALYGSRANNGVIQIFTKQGRSGDTRVTYTTEVGMNRTPDTYDLNTVPFATFTDVLFGPADAVGDPVERFDIQDEIFRTGITTSNRLAVSGGTGGTTFYVSGGFETEEGIIRSSDYERLNFRANLSQQLGSKLDITARAGYIQSESHFIPEGEQTQGVLTSIIFTPTSFDPSFDANLGRFPYNPVLGPNPFTVLNSFEAPENVTRFIGSFEASARPLESVTLRYLVGIDDYRREARYFQPPLSTGPNFGGSVQAPVNFSRLFNNDLTATHVWDPSTTFGLNSAVGFRYTSDRSESIRAAAGDLPPGTNLVSGATQFASQGITELHTVGAYIEERLSINEQLYLTGGVNWDASSAFGEAERVQMFPRASISYILGEAPFWQDLAGETVSSLRLRAAYGQTGGQPPGVYTRFDNYVDVAFSGLAGLIPSSIAGNANLKPERQREYEFGFDLGMFEDRAQLEFTYYDKKTTDLVLGVPLPPSRGFQLQFQNIGELSNKGVEVALNTVNLSTGDLTWRSRLIYSANRNEIQELVTATDTLTFDYLNAVIVGQPIGVFYGGTYARDANGDVAYDARGLPLRGRDTIVVNGVTTIANSRRIIGDPNPDFTAAFSNTLEIGRNIELSVLLDGRFGNDVANFSRRISELFGADAITALEATGDTASRTFTLNPNGRSLIYEEYIEDGSYVKLREVALSYRLNQPFIQALGTDAITLRVAGRNLYTWTDYRGLDPEINLFSANTVSRGVDFATTPLPRQFTFSATFNF